MQIVLLFAIYKVFLQISILIFIIFQEIQIITSPAVYSAFLPGCTSKTGFTELMEKTLLKS